MTDGTAQRHAGRDPASSPQREGKTIEAVDVFVSGRSGPDARPGRQLLAAVPCEELPQVLEKLIPYLKR